MSNPHSPGPWHVSAKDRHDQPTVTAADGRLVAVCAHECVDERGADANAALIAVAPRMLALLQDIESVVDRNSGPLARDHIGDRLRGIVENCRHVIAKATEPA